MKNQRFKKAVHLIMISIAVLMLSMTIQHALFAEPTTTMEYKGYLEEDGEAVNTSDNDTRQFEVFLVTNPNLAWNPNHASQVWEHEIAGDTSVINGHFTLVFAPPTDVLQRAPLYIRIRVRRNNGGYVTLTGAQELRATPHASTARYASDARNAENATNATGSTEDFRVRQNLRVDGTSTHTGSVTHSGNVTTNGSTTQRNVTTNGTSTLNGNVKITGDESTGTNDTGVALRVWNGADRLAIDGDEIDANGTLYIQNNSGQNTWIGDDLTVARNLTVQDNLTVEDNATVQDNLTVNGDLTVRGDIELGISYSNEYEVDNVDNVAVFMGSADGRLCFLTHVDNPGDGFDGNCKVRIMANNQWQLSVFTNRNGEKHCKARCLVWDND